MELVLNRRDLLFRSAASVGALAVGSALVVGVDGCSTNWVTVVLNDIPTVVNIVESIVAVVSTATGNGALSAAVAAEITLAVNALSAGLKAFQDAVNAYDAAKTQGNIDAVIAALKAVQNDANGVLSSLPAGTITSSVATIIVASIGMIIFVLSSIQSLIPGAVPAPVAIAAKASALKSKAVIPNAAAIKFGYNALLSTHGYAALAIN